MTTTPSTAIAPAGAVRGWRHPYAVAAADWRAVNEAELARDADLVTQWEDRLVQLQACHLHLVQTGSWRGGPRTLLAALSLQYRELAMTAGLAWLLRQDGHHGLGPGVLSRLLTHVGLNGADAGPDVRIVLEERREQTRADLVVYGDAWTVVVEAKIFAVEQEHQLDRLHLHWQDDPNPQFVFLTHGLREAITAVDSRNQWQPLTWHQVAVIVRAAATSVAEAAPGVYDYIATLQAHHRD